MKKDKKSLRLITEPIFDDIKLFEKEFRDALSSEVRLINLVGKYIIRHKGKHIRPILTLLASRVCGQPNLNSYKAAAMIELLHIATLIHDDVVDEAEKRRGFLSINRIWKNKISILMGDFIFSKALIKMVGLKDFAALQLIADTAEKLAAGEILQIEKSLTRSMTEEVYYQMIYKKTASLISTSCELGAITSTGEKNDRKAMITYGTKLGMAFQIKDDLFDLLGNEKQTGKDIGADLKRNMVTLPLIYTYEQINRSKLRKLKKIISSKKKTNSDIHDLNEIVHDAGGFNYAEEKINELNSQAFEAITMYPESTYKQSMIDLINFNTQRSS
ncbi:MAG: polyprenyl synthetase family protein [Candidatus Marinimicrobia bacterium]|jgi:octaprenyl-diphosphate synthase|nr:polyprenyl synthetase family protein [Candidatus Neomarinimicrobiota bacterium]MBT3797093.1 polyprenyl synthetase family protein [Candidatus Neomarinimicrobiota bacterium]MBT4149550.1 polyprenyl synthetase family protein [Candidatus Neomarinimicrobiota bacterium]MBT4317988.1 polyprenyl synthetase family protein [Candidatus Neomarinimicrobiota bacterium]MBT4783862.1 polyprenyl synthetase family protein [Candidatus Neomarinimicrobiota bacterium]|tara:strand:- start:6118 stop:7107 length:990 start_codon:yes stop_codon:yes gene_type:complete